MEHTSEIIKRLTYRFVKILIESTSSELKVPVKFVDIYDETCRTTEGSIDKYKSYIEMKQYVRENLLKDGYIFVDPKDVDTIYLTQKAIDEYSDY
jgi:hypothetical protein